MEIVKIAVEWAKSEVFSAKIFICFGILFILATSGFWQLGKTELAKAFIIPTLIAGGLLLSAGFSFYFSNKARVPNFEAEYNSNPSSFITTEIYRVEKTMSEYETVAFKVFPVIIAVAALLIVFVDKPIWKAIFITIIAFLTVLILVDSHANERMEKYHNNLILQEKTTQ